MNQSKFSTKTKFLTKPALAKLQKNNFKIAGTPKKDFDIFVQKTYKIIGNVETTFEHRTRKNRHLDKEHVRTVEFNKLVSDVIAHNILKLLCKKNTLETNDITKNLLDEYKTFNSDNSDTITNDFQIGIASGIAEILTYANGGIILPEIKNKINKVNQRKNFAEIDEKRDPNFCNKNYVIEKRWKKVAKHIASVNLRTEEERNLERQSRRVENKHRLTIPPPPSDTVRNNLSSKQNLMDTNRNSNNARIKKQLADNDGAKLTTGGNLVNETSKISSLPGKRSVTKKNSPTNRKENIKKNADNLQIKNKPNGDELPDKSKNPVLVVKRTKLSKNLSMPKQLDGKQSKNNDLADKKPTVSLKTNNNDLASKKPTVSLKTNNNDQASKKPTVSIKTNNNDLAGKKPTVSLKTNNNAAKDSKKNTGSKSQRPENSVKKTDITPIQIINDRSDRGPKAAKVRPEIETVDQKPKVKMNMTSDPKTSKTKVDVKKADGQKSMPPGPPVKSVVMSDVAQIDEVCKSDETLTSVIQNVAIDDGVGISGKKTLPAKPEEEKHQKNDRFDGEIPIATAKDEITAEKTTPDDEVIAKEILLATPEVEMADGGTPTSVKKNHTSDVQTPKDKMADGSTTNGGKASNENILTETATKIGQPMLPYIKNERPTVTDGARKEKDVNDEKTDGKDVWSNQQPAGPSKFPDDHRVKTLHDQTKYVCPEKAIRQSNYADKNIFEAIRDRSWYGITELRSFCGEKKRNC